MEPAEGGQGAGFSAAARPANSCYTIRIQSVARISMPGTSLARSVTARCLSSTSLTVKALSLLWSKSLPIQQWKKTIVTDHYYVIVIILTLSVLLLFTDYTKMASRPGPTSKQEPQYGCAIFSHIENIELAF